MDLVLDDLDLGAPVRLSGPPMTDDEILAFSSEHEDLEIEVNARGEFEIVPNAGFRSSQRNGEITEQLFAWTRADGRGFATDSSALFRLPSGARRSPDGAWTEKCRVEQFLADSTLEVFPVCPDFVIELRSPTDRKPHLEDKMLEWIENGAKLAWLIDPIDRTTTVYRPGREPQVVTGTVVRGEGPVTGFDLKLDRIYPF